MHLSLLHLDESTTDDDEYVEFYYYYFTKDLFAFFVYSCLFTYMVFYAPGHLNHPDNYIAASSSVTPAHLVPEWYFLPFYAVLRSTPDKFGGLVMMFLTLVDLFIVDFIDDTDESSCELTLSDESEEADLVIEDDSDAGTLFIIFFLGGKDIDEPYTDLSTVLTFLQFSDYFDLEDAGDDDDLLTKSS